MKEAIIKNDEEETHGIWYFVKKIKEENNSDEA